MSLPIIRKEVFFSIEGKNISLADLRGSTYAGIEILSVESFESKPSSLTRVRQALKLLPTTLKPTTLVSWFKLIHGKYLTEVSGRMNVINNEFACTTV